MDCSAYASVAELPGDAGAGRGRRAGSGRAGRGARLCAPRRVRPASLVLSAGFAEAGAEGARAQDELLAICRAAGMRLVGPNCLGVMGRRRPLDATFVPHAPPAGPRGRCLSQSGGVGLALIERPGPRPGAVLVRLDREPARYLGQRRARVLGGGRVDRAWCCSTSSPSATRATSCASRAGSRGASPCSRCVAGRSGAGGARRRLAHRRGGRGVRGRDRRRCSSRRAWSGRTRSASSSTSARCLRLPAPACAVAGWRSSPTPADRRSCAPTPARRTASSCRSCRRACVAAARAASPGATPPPQSRRHARRSRPGRVRAR